MIEIYELIKELWRRFLTTPCPNCPKGRISHSHTEPMSNKWTIWIEVYQCDICGDKFV